MNLSTNELINELMNSVMDECLQAPRGIRTNNANKVTLEQQEKTQYRGHNE